MRNACCGSSASMLNSANAKQALSAVFACPNIYRWVAYLLTIIATEKLAYRISSDNDDLVHVDTQQLEQVVPAFVSMIMMWGVCNGNNGL